MASAFVSFLKTALQTMFVLMSPRVVRTLAQPRYCAIKRLSFPFHLDRHSFEAHAEEKPQTAS